MYEVHPQTFKQITGYQLLLAIHPPNFWFLLVLLRSRFWIAGTYPFGNHVFGLILCVSFCGRWRIFSVVHWFGVTCISYLMVTEKVGRILQKTKLSWRNIKITANRFCWLWSCNFKIKKHSPKNWNGNSQWRFGSHDFPFQTRCFSGFWSFGGRKRPNEFTTFQRLRRKLVSGRWLLPCFWVWLGFFN